MQRHARAPARDALGEAEGSLNILLVEDTRGERLLLEAFLRGQGHEVLTAEHGAQAMELFDEDTIDLVLMDVAMPAGGGRNRGHAAPQGALPGPLGAGDPDQ